MTITQKSYAGCSFTVSQILFKFRFPQPLAFFDFRVKNWETSWFTVVLGGKKKPSTFFFSAKIRKLNGDKLNFFFT